MLPLFCFSNHTIVAKTYILNQTQAAQKLQRMALEIAERNTDASRIVLAGVEPNGSVMSTKLKALLEPVFKGTVEEITITLDKRHPEEIILSQKPKLEGAVLILVDDVANSGKTLTYALKPFLHQYPQKIQILVMVERTHKLFPVHADYVGHTLATTLQEFIDMEVRDGEILGAWME